MNKFVSVGFSILLHLLIFTAAGFLIIKPAQFGVNLGAAVDVELDGDSGMTQSQMDSAPAVPKIEESDFQEKAESVKTKVPQSSVSSVVEATPGGQSGGITTHADPNYLQNPAPVYPESARRRGQQGTVLLMVSVDKSGRPTRVELKTSSGFSILDEAAIRAVRKWAFKPAMAGAFAVDSQVEVPVRFQIK